MDPKPILYLGTVRTTVNILIPFRSVPTDGRALRRALSILFTAGSVASLSWKMHVGI